MVCQSMAIGTQSNQILLAVASQVTSGLDVMDLQVPSRSTELAPPTHHGAGFPDVAFGKRQTQGASFPALQKASSRRGLNLLKNVVPLLGRKHGHQSTHR
jgi:hypothetical protein